MWTVVKFLQEDTVEVVPCKWINYSNSTCSWPPTSSKVPLFIKKNEDPVDNWLIYDIKLLTNKKYNDFDIANRKAYKAKYVSDISSNESEEPFRRRLQKPCRYRSSSEESLAEEGPLLPKPPGIYIISLLSAIIKVSCSMKRTNFKHKFSCKSIKYFLFFRTSPRF